MKCATKSQATRQRENWNFIISLIHSLQCCLFFKFWSLVQAYTMMSNIKYDSSINEISPAATHGKFVLSFVLRFVDGIYSLMVNFILLLITNEVLSLFLNFAALAFLQSIGEFLLLLVIRSYFFFAGLFTTIGSPHTIFYTCLSVDDLAFHLAANGYVGDYMEDKCAIVKTADLPRRQNARLTKNLDSILFLSTYLIMLSCFVYVTVTYDFNKDT